MKLIVSANSIFLTNLSDVSRLSRRTKRDVTKLVYEQMVLLQGDIRGKFFPWRSRGRVYRSRKYNRPHIASLPGYPPNMDTGRLRRSVVVKKAGGASVVLSANIPAPEPNYAVYLEFGSNVGGKLAPRPFFYKTIAKRIKSAAFKHAIARVRYAIANELSAKNGILKNGKWRVVK